MRLFLKTLFITFIFLVGLVVIAFFAVPHVAGAMARRALAKNPTYDGNFKNLNMDLLKGRMTLTDLVLQKKGEKEGEPFLKSGSTMVRIHWRPLLKREVIGEVKIIDPEVHIVAHAAEEEQEKAKEVVKEKNVIKMIEQALPFRVDRFEVQGGTVTYLNNTAKPPIKIQIDGIRFIAENLTNREALSDKLPARASLALRIMKSGQLGVKLQFDPFAESPLFDMDMRLKNLELRSMNGFIRHYAQMDVAKGTLSLASETSVNGGRYKGYLKPILRDFEMREKGESHESFLSGIKEWAVDTLEHIFENDETETAATRVPFEGTLKSREVDIWSAVVEIFRNAFVRALNPAVEGRQKLGQPKN